MGKRKYQKARRVREEGFTPIANSRRAAEMAMLARSSAAGCHDSRPRRQRTRASAARAEIRSHLCS